MPLLDSFTVDHTQCQHLLYAKTMKTPSGDTITVFDFFTVPNEEAMTEKGTHTLEHLLQALCVITSTEMVLKLLIFHQWGAVLVFI